MRRLLRAALVVILLAFVAAQFAPVERTNPPVDPAQTVEQLAAVPPEVRAVLDRSCKDCHSNQTHWPFYAYVAPSSWLVTHDVSRAREEVNFSEWGQYDPDSERDLLIEICRQLQRGDMPLWQYTLIHRSARLSTQEVDQVCTWTEQIRKTLHTAE
jgi:Haem-binding domain